MAAAGDVFFPSDKDMIMDYLRPMVEGQAIAEDARVTIVDMGEELYKREPWMLPVPNPETFLRFYFGKRTEPEGPIWMVGQYYRGSWTPRYDLEIRSSVKGKIIGERKSYRFDIRDKMVQEGRMMETNWYMTEYRLIPSSSSLQDQQIPVLCRINNRTI